VAPTGAKTFRLRSYHGADRKWLMLGRTRRSSWRRPGWRGRRSRT